MKQRRFPSSSNCMGCNACPGLMKTETSKRVTYECKIPLQEGEAKHEDRCGKLPKDI